MRRLAAAATLALSCTLGATALAEVDHFKSGVDALAEGKFEQAVLHLEAHADQAPSHPDASYNRGLAYVARVRAGRDRPGDLGRAAAAFEETLLMRPGDADAVHALELVHAEVARRWARRGKDLVQVRPTLDRLIVGLASERAWAIAAIVSAFVLALGLALRRPQSGRLRLAGLVSAPAGVLGLVVFLPLTVGARQLRTTTRPAVVVVREAHLMDGEGTTKGLEPIPEAARLETGERRGRLVHIRHGSTEGWLPGSALRFLRDR